jgi:uncharacterized membrane protein YkgB
MKKHPKAIHFIEKIQKYEKCLISLYFSIVLIVIENVQCNFFEKICAMKKSVPH